MMGDWGFSLQRQRWRGIANNVYVSSDVQSIGGFPHVSTLVGSHSVGSGVLCCCSILLQGCFLANGLSGSHDQPAIALLIDEDDQTLNDAYLETRPHPSLSNPKLNKTLTCDRRMIRTVSQ